MYDQICLSNDSSGSDYEMNAETLDKLYKEQLQTLRDLVLRHHCVADVKTCSKWLQVFSKTTMDEKLARNCLCALMQQQLAECGCLFAPFTDMQNCNRDLNLVLHDLDAQSCNSRSFTADYNKDAIDGDEPLSPLSAIKQEEPTPMIRLHLAEVAAVSERSELIAQLTCHENEIKTENVLLRRELEALRLQLTDKQIENVKLRELAERRREAATNMERIETFASIQKLLLTSVMQTLNELQSTSLSPPPPPDMAHKIFERVFRDFTDDTDFCANIRKIDEHYQRWLAATLEQQLQERQSCLCRKLSHTLNKTKLKLRNKYERRLRIQNWAQRLQLKLVKLKCFSALRRIFIDTQESGAPNANMWEILRAMEEKYQAVVNELI